jgi:hypothetical protein
MTRLCMDCGIELGEKCPTCGSLDVQDAQIAGVAAGKAKFCQTCGLLFDRGRGGQTHGLCAKCVHTRAERPVSKR